MMDLDKLKEEHPVYEVAGKWVALRAKKGHNRNGLAWTHMGACPMCSGTTDSRTATRFQCNALHWSCAVCSDGGDVIKLVGLYNWGDGSDKTFRPAIDWLGGAQQVDPEQEERRKKEREERRLKLENDQKYYREKRRRRLYQVYDHALSLPGTPAEAYLRLRGLTRLPHGAKLRCVLDMPYFDGEDDDKNAKIIHRGPAMVAAITRPDGVFGGLHITWIDLTKPKGKVELYDAEGELLEAKKARGSKSGGHVVLWGPPEPTQLILGEGLEKTGAVWLSYAETGRDLTRTAFWVALDLGNLAGRAAATVAHPTRRTEHNRPERVPGPVPDLEAPAIAIPDSVEDLVLLGDTTSDPFLTKCAMARAHARYVRPGRRRVRCAWPPDGIDYDEMVPRGETDGLQAG
jgi:hypothetical protein